MQLTTNGVYWVFMAMVMQFLEVKCKVSYEEAKNMIAFVPMFGALVIFLTMLVAKWIENETKLLWFAAFLGFSTMTTIGLFDFTGVVSGMIILSLHSIYGSIMVACYWPCVSKNVSKNLISLGNGFAVTMNDLAIASGPLVTGMFMGKKGTEKTIEECCLFLGIMSSLGLLAASILVYTDRYHVRQEVGQKNMENELMTDYHKNSENSEKISLNPNAGRN
jgi:hypothetical protein